MLKKVRAGLIDLLLGHTCHACNRSIACKETAYDEHLCASCAGTLARTSVTACRLCGKELVRDNELKSLICTGCRQNKAPYELLLTCFVYQGATRNLIHKYKYENRPYLARTLGRLMIENLNKDRALDFTAVDAFTYIPLHPARRREREFNQSRLLAEYLSEAFDKPLLSTLKRIRDTKPQASLEGKERIANLASAFETASNGVFNGKKLVLIDDVVTTTTTVREAASVLKSNGAGSVTILAFAKG